MFDDIVRALRDLQEALAETRSDLAKERAARERMFRKGKVTDVDTSKWMYRQEVGVDENGKPVKGPWCRYSQVAGARKGHSPPSVGEQYMMISPDGDFDQAVGYPLGWSDDNPPPSTKADEDVDQRGKSKDTTRADSRQIECGGASIKVEDGKLTLTVGGASLTIDGDGHHFAGGAVDHDGKKIDKTHKHTGVLPGGALTGEPS